ncbi:MAG: PhzF family phenazine biosynthesis protein [Leptolyngbya sp. SIO1E4]|nr:PhzF family phenazine biosynthesis protein [Leptolyngbya sp. SIO1E4]
MRVSAPINILQVDAFTDSPFGGNPAAVCVLPAATHADWMQAIAAEMNLSETAFLYPVEEGYHLRWFTPAAEVDLCGHATLASAHVLWSEGYLSATQTARFQTQSGLLTATQAEGWITLNFPARPVTAIAATPELLKSLRGLQPSYTGCSGDSADANFLVELASEAYVRSLQPDFGMMRTLPVQGVIVTAPADDPKFDFVSRYFAPAIGINEDPVTGAAHCSLTPYWQAKLGKSDLMAQQVSARGGILKVQFQGERVLISGQAVTVLKGLLLSAPVPAPQE